MNPTSQASSNSEPTDFRSLFEADRAAGHTRTLAEYLSLFQGCDAEIATEYLKLREPSEPAGLDHDGTRSLGPYRIVRELGRGGQGVVYLARDERLGRNVALKVLTGLEGLAPKSVARFQREAALASKLDHPGICQVFEAGVHDRIPFISMRFVEGPSLQQLLAVGAGSPTSEADDSDFLDLTEAPKDAVDESPAPWRRTPKEIRKIARLIERTARALHAAHEAGVIHRDIKPANIMVTSNDQPVIMDFGLARDEDGDLQTLTRTGDIFGTPAYMSPEQIAAQRITLDRRTDIYSLGAVLYEALAGRRPFDSMSREKLYHAILTEEPEKIRQGRPDISRDLEVVTMTAMEKNRERRYQTALEFAEDLRRVADYEPIRARPAGRWLRLRRWSQRNPVLATSLGAGVLLLMVATGLLSHGIATAGRLRLEERLHQATVNESRRIEAERQSLAQSVADRKIVHNIEELGTRMGLLVYVLNSEVDLLPLCEQYLDAYAAFGLDFRGGAPLEHVLEQLRALERARPEVFAVVLHGVYDLHDAFELASLRKSSDSRAAQVLEARVRLGSVLAQAESDPWVRRLWELTQRPGDKQAVLEHVHLRKPAELSPSALSFAAAAVMQADEEAAVPFLDFAIEKYPDDYAAHVLRGVIAVIAAASKGSQKDSPVAVHHLGVAVALRPRSGPSHAMLAMALGILTRDHFARGESEEGMAAGRRCESTMLRGLEIEPDSALLWYLKGFLSEKSGQRQHALESFRKALELDPSMRPAREAVERLGS